MNNLQINKRYELNTIHNNISNNKNNPQEIQNFLTYINKVGMIRYYHSQEYYRIQSMKLNWEEEVKVIDAFLNRKRTLVEKISSKDSYEKYDDKQIIK